MTELEARATEPGRYHNRGGQLLREEKERKAIASNVSTFLYVPAVSVSFCPFSSKDVNREKQRK